MTRTIERLRVSILNSNGYRRFAKQGIGRRIFRGRVYRRIHLFTNYWTSYYQSIKSPALFQDIRTICLFIGHNKSGTTLIGSLLDAHPNVILADDMGVLQFVSAGFSRSQIFHLLLKGSRREFMKGRVTGRRMNAYSFLVPGQWQGRYSRLRVVGDSTSGSSTEKLGEDPNLLDHLRQIMPGVDIKFIQVIRNPYDPISISMVRGKRTFEDAVNHYFNKCDILIDLRKRLGKDNLLAVKYENFIGNPEMHLRELCNYLGIEADQDYLKACTSILYKSPEQNRHIVDWDTERIKVVKDKLAPYDFLEGYSFEV